MVDELRPSDEDVPPAGESVHLPEPSLLPVIVAAGVAIALVGVVISWVVVVIGVIPALIAIVRWIRETREDIAELPLEH
jgi:Cytochrome c oxidase subunit IV